MKAIIQRIQTAAILAVLFAIGLASTARAAAPVPTVVWESDFGTATKTGTDGNSYTIELNDNTVTDGNIVIASGASKGAIVNTSAANASSMTVLIKYTSAPSPSASVVPASIYCYRTSGSIPDVGMVTYRASSYQNYACWYVQSGSREFNSTDGTDPVMSASGGYLMMSYDCATLRVYAGNTIAALAGGAKAYAWGSSKMNYVGLGGPTGKTTGLQWNAWGGMVIEKVAIFPGNAYSNTDLADYVWPSAEKYRKWAYANNVYTWVPSKDSSDIGASNNGTLYQFDVASGEDTSTTLASGSDNWKQFCIGQTQYSAPGSALRFTSSSANKTFTGGFSPFTFGGIIVESDAGGLSIGTANDGRTTVFGAASGATETWFGFDADASVIRSGAFRFSGNVNLDIANGKTLSLAAAGSPAIVASVNDNKMATTAGGTLRVHGGGKLAATLNASGAALDFSDQPTASASAASAYIQGALTVDDDTTFTFPEGATFPYFVATSISGDIDYTSGYKANADGSISEVASLSITTTDAVDLPTTWTSSDDAIVIVAENIDATLNVTAAATLSTMTFYVPATSTLTISGSAITASTIYFPRTGIVKVSAAGALVGTANGVGTVSYPSHILPAAGAVWTNTGWTGTVILNDCGADCTGTSGHGYVDLGSYGNANSFIRAPGYKGYTATGLNCTATLVIADGETFTLTDGNGSTKPYFAKLKGAGTLAVAKARSADTQYTFGDVSEFTGNITFDSTATEKVVFGGVKDTAYTGKFVIAGSVAIAAGATWNMAAGITVNGTLTVPSTATLTGAISGSGTIVANQQFPVPDSSFTGTLSVTGGATPITPLESTATAVYGSVLNISGAVYLSGNVTTLPGTINIASGAYLMFGNAEMTSLALTVGTWDGMLYIADQCTALETLTVGAGTLRELSSAKFAPGSSTTLATVNIVFDEVKGDGGTITLTSATGLTAVEGRTYNFTVRRVDDTTVTGAYDSATSKITYTPAISGAATDIDWDFTDGEDDDLEQKPSGVGKNADSTMTFYTDATDSTKTGVYIKHHPYITGAASFMGNNSAAMSVAVVGTMPATQNTIFLNVGSAYDQKYGLVFLTTATANEVLIGYNYGGTVTPITTMTVPNSSTARHSYIVTKQDGDSTTTFTVYLDGIKWKTVTTASKITFPSSNSGVQVGSDFGGNIRNAGTYSAASDDVGVLNVLRVYGRIITEAEITVYASTFPYVSPNGASSRTFATAAEDWVEATDTDWANTSGGTTTQGTAPSAGASVTVTAAEATEITVNLANDTQYEALTINGSAVTLAKGANSGKISVTGMTVVGAPVTVEYGAADFTGGPMTITEDGTITFDYSGYDISGIYTTTDIPLTSDVEQNDAKVTLMAPTATYQTASLVYTSGHYAMRVTPVHEAGTELYYKSGYFGKNAAAGEEFTVVLSDGTTTAPVFPGDIVVIDSKSSQDPIYVGELPDNVSAIRIDRTTRLSSGNASIAMLDGATVTVGENGSLTIFRNWNEIHLGNVVLNGTSVSLDQNANGSVSNGQSATLSVSGAVSGTAVLTISGTVNVASGGSIANAVAGSGTIAYAAIPATRPSSYTGWTGTVALPAFTGGEIALNNYGVAGSTVRVSTSTLGYLSNATVLPTIELGGDWTLPNFSASFANEFTAITGSGTLTLGATLDVTADNWYSNYSAFLKIGSVAGFSGSITLQSNGPGIVIGGAKPAYRESGGKILVYGNVTVGETATWTAPNGVILADANATLVVPSGATVSAPTSGVSEYIVQSVTTDGTTTYSLLAGTVADDIFVPTTWSNVHASGVADLTTTAPNGYSYVACYALGLDPTDADDKPIVSVSVVNGNYVFTVKHRNADGELVEITPADNVTTTVTLKYGTDADTQSWTSAVGTSFAPNALPFGESSNVIYYKAEVTISAK